MPLRRAEAAAANFTSILVVPHALGFLLQLMRMMRGNSRQLLFLKEELIDKKVSAVHARDSAASLAACATQSG